MDWTAIRIGWAAALMVALAGCGEVVVQQPGGGPAPAGASAGSGAFTRDRAELAAKQFVSVVATVEPVAERVCRQRSPQLNCDFLIVVDDRPDQPANAYQTLDRSGRPVLAFTLGLIADVQNEDELAFVMSHEAAHHIANHLERQKVSAVTGAQVLGGLATMSGASNAGIDLAVRIGAAVGSRTYSKDFELEADALGARIARDAGYDALRGALYFNRIPDPGDRFLGSHPPNSDRLATVRRSLGQG